MIALACVAMTGLLVILYLFDPAGASFYPRCVFHMLTGLQCPGCGLTRATHQLLHGHFANAFRLNAFGVVFAPLLFVSAVAEVRAAVRGDVQPRLLQRAWIGWTAVALVVAWGVIRNIIHV